MKEIIILLPGPFVKSDYERFGIEILKKNFSVKILDFTAWQNPYFWKQYSQKVYKCNEYKSISCKDDFLELKFEEEKLFVFDLNLNSSYNCIEDKKIRWAKEKLKKKNSFFVNIDTSLIPRPKTTARSLIKKLFNLVTQPKRKFFMFLKILKNKFYSMRKNYTPDVLVQCGLSTREKVKAKNILYAHCTDYDVYLNMKNKPEIKKDPYAVFIDEGMTNHQDYYYLGIKPPVSENQYYPTLIKFLKKFEIESGLKVKFAIHPKSLNINISKFLKDFDCSSGNTAELVKSSSIVLLHASSALSYAILFNKPTVFLTSKDLNKSWIGPEINSFAQFMSVKAINMNKDLDKKINIQNLLKINKEKYKNYLDQFLKVPNSKDIPLWEIVTEYVQNQ